MSSVLRAGYGLWCWVAFVAIALVVLVLGLSAPTVLLRRSMARRGARLFFALAGIRFVVRGLERLPDEACVVVANHSSYIDGVVLQAALPPRFAFVIKKEMVRVPLAGLLLRRLGSEFVDRFDRHQGSVDARRVLKTALAGESLAVFPEGTFTAAVGLPVVPAAIVGARAVLPCDAWLPRRAAIEVEILARLAAPPAGAERLAAVRLKDAARQALLARLGEADLAG